VSGIYGIGVTSLKRWRSTDLLTLLAPNLSHNALQD
jgi:hypothetical protein